MKGVILAGGLGTRLFPLTKITNKHLLPVYDRPMIYYPIQCLVNAGVRDIMIVTGGRKSGDFLSLLGNGKDFGLKHLNYTYQEGEGGIAEALGLAEHWATGDSICVVLGDNIIQYNVAKAVREFQRQQRGAKIMLKEVHDPERFGVAELDGQKVANIIEKPKQPKSNLAVIGIYMYDARVFEIIKKLEPSERGELEITDVNNWYIKDGSMTYDVLNGWWTDAGTFESLHRASCLVAEGGANLMSESAGSDTRVAEKARGESSFHELSPAVCCAAPAKLATELRLLVAPRRRNGADGSGAGELPVSSSRAMGASEASRVLVTGAAGMLGSELLLCTPAGVTALGTDLIAAPSVALPGLDLTDVVQVERAWREHGPFDGVIHCAAYTAVDKAESERELARHVNVIACEVLAHFCAANQAHLVAVSTDFVFDGDKRTPYIESDTPRPLSVYGATKLDGERAALAAHPSGTAIVRTQWLYGPRGKHFPRTIVGFAREKGRLRVVDDQVGAPTSTLELAPALWDVLAKRAVGVFHAACEGACSWHGFTRAILDECELTSVALEPCATTEFPRPAQRPAYSVLDSAKLARLRGRPLAPWRTALRDYLAVEPL